MNARAKTALLALTLAGCASLERRLDQLDARTTRVRNEELAAATAGRAPEPATDCIDGRAGLRIAAGTLIATDGDLIYVSATDRRCARGRRICEGDRFQTLPRTRVAARPICEVGPWTPYRRISIPRPITARSG